MNSERSPDEETAALCIEKGDQQHPRTTANSVSTNASSDRVDHYLGATRDSDSDDNQEEARKIAEKETIMVRLWRFVTTDVLIMTSCTVVLSAYAILRSLEYYDFQEAYGVSSEALAAALEKVESQNVAALTGLAASLSTSINSSTLFQPPDFQAKAKLIHQLSSMDTIYYAPLVSEENKEAYLSYVNQLQLTPEETSESWYGYHSYITWFNSDEEAYVHTSSKDFYFPILNSSPPPPPDQEGSQILNWDLTYLATSSNSSLLLEYLSLLGSNQTLLIPPSPSSKDDQRSYMLSPIQQQDTTEVVGLLVGGFSLPSLLKSVLTQHSRGLVIVVTYDDACYGLSDKNSTEGVSYTYEVQETDSVVQSTGDFHDKYYNDYEVPVDMGTGIIATQCHAQMSIYPSRATELYYRTPFPEVITFVLAISFALVGAAFFRYDVLVDQRNEKLMNKFSRSNAIVSSLFPKTFRDRLMGEGNEEDNRSELGEDSKKVAKTTKSHMGRLKSLMSQEGRYSNNYRAGASSTNPSKPLADIFPDVSIIFADIAGFTAWSSSREPHQVFTLLETLYCGFDEIAKRRRIFKVETIGDCYVAASGLPDSQPDHAVRMVRFGIDILHKAHVLTRELEVILGPDTGDLNMRAGIHSGTVTAGILRGQKARFQLFGDAMNTASRVESNGMPGKIQVSQSTADLIIQAGHKEWLQIRPEKIVAKGKGLMQTYWVTHTIESGNNNSTSTLGTWDDDYISHHEFDDKWPSSDNRSASKIVGMPQQLQLELRLGQNEQRMERLVEWNVATLSRLMKKIIAHRQEHCEVTEQEAADLNMCMLDQQQAANFQSPLDEVKEIITLPEFTKAKTKKVNPSCVRIPTKVMEQLQDLVGVIGRSYRNNHFHNFDHGSHVVMSVSKLLSRIVDPRDVDSADAKAAHDHTYGITSDPLTQFACAFSALIHDADHEGVPNSQLAKEKTDLALRYNNISVAEQNSLDLSWEVFMSSEYDELRNTICATPSELKRLREIVVNAVMATDIVNQDLKAQRNARWEKAFATNDSTCNSQFMEGNTGNSPRDAVNRKATIVIEHLMQASDVAHTMQHWHVYRKWNERLLREAFKAYKEGRNEHNPLLGWYDGELSFFDFYIIPLAKKLQECGVFGVSSDEYLNYALNNRDEWEERGKEIVTTVALSLAEEYKDH